MLNSKIHRRIVVAGFAASLLAPVSAAFADNFKTPAQIRKELEEGVVAPGRGIRPAATSPGAAASSAHPAAAAAPAAQRSAPAIDLEVLFASGSDELTPQAIRQVDALGEVLKDMKSNHFRIEGHTDTTGSPDANLDLSRRRATAVYNYLVGKFGIEAQRIEAVGKGQTELAVPTRDQTPEPRNRRVRVVNLGA